MGTDPIAVADPANAHTPLGALGAAVRAARAGDDEEATAALRRVLDADALGSARPELQRLVGQLAVVVGDEALAERCQATLRAARAADPFFARRAEADVLAAFGRLHEARDVLLAAIECAPNPARAADAHLALGTLYGPRACFDGAFHHLGRAAALGRYPARARAALELEASGHALAAGRREDAHAHAARALALSPTDRLVRLEAARVFVATGDGPTAAALYHEVLGDDPADAAALEGLVRVALYGGDVAAAKRPLARLDGPVAATLASCVALVEGDLAAAERAADEAIATGRASAEAYLVRAETRMRRGAFDDAFLDVDAGVVRARGYHFAGRLLHKRIGVASGIGWQATSHAHEDYEATLLALDPASIGPLRDASLESAARLLDAVLAALSGNRTETPTVRRPDEPPGVFSAVPHRPSPRHAAREALQRIAVEPEAVVQRALEDVCAAFPQSPTPLCHLGELQLWMGRYGDAHASFEAALAITVARWGYIGRGAAELLLGDPERALATLAEGVRRMDNTTGPSLFVYRGEACFALGQLEAAQRDLEHSTESTPRRIAAWALLARVRAARGDLDGADRALARFAVTARPLWLDALRETGSALSSYREAPEATDAVLAHALRMLRGNRSSSCHVYALADGTLRDVPLTLADPARARSRALDGIERALRGAGARR